MTGRKKFDRHANMVERMAAVQGIDLDEALQRAKLSADELRGGVYACIGCSNVENCEHWLAGHGDGADAAPGYCRNNALFKKLAEKA